MSGGDGGEDADVKSEYLVPDPRVNASREDLERGKDDTGDGDGNQVHGSKKQKKKGMNKNRPPPVKFDRASRLCPVLVDVPAGDPGVVPKCHFPNCAFVHDVAKYLASKKEPVGTECHVYRTLGKCPRGATCVFSADHVDPVGEDGMARNRTDKAAVAAAGGPQESNHLHKELQNRLWKKTVDFSKCDEVVEEAYKTREKMVQEQQRKREEEQKKEGIKNGNDDAASEKAVKASETKSGDEGEAVPPPEKMIKMEEDSVPEKNVVKVEEASAKTDTPKPEKKRIDWRDKLYLAPLTTVGNLPFRRVCKRLGADITCGEMAMALPLLQGHRPEWALVHRHRSEDLFGVQLCGGNPHQMARAASLLTGGADGDGEGGIDCDFLDINLGCPIDLVYKKGMGSGMMARRKPLEVTVRAMAAVMGDRPLTVKMRTGVYGDKPIAHELIPAVREWGAAAVTLHGRSREQRYTRLADWEYVARCVDAAGDMPVFGNGDIMSYEDYERNKEASKCAGVMIARGALIKPWIFTEIKERRHWDISAGERMDMVKEFANNGLEHWGSDDKGVETTRRFLLEWLSFLHRYVPVGLLERPPQRINQRLPHYRGRSDAETLLASPDCADWIRITEMYLGKVPDGFRFEPKHRANAYK